MIVTDDWLRKHCTANGAYTRKQFEIIGLKWPPYAGWKKDIIGKHIDAEKAELFIRSKENKYTRRNKKAGDKNIKILDEHNIDYDVYNNGNHIKICRNDLVIDFWPTTGTYMVNAKGEQPIKGNGVHSLIEYLKKQGG